MNWQVLMESKLVENLGWTLVHSMWEIGVVTGILFILLRIIRPASTDLRYGISVIALLISAGKTQSGATTTALRRRLRFHLCSWHSAWRCPALTQPDRPIGRGTPPRKSQQLSGQRRRLNAPPLFSDER